MNKVMISVAPVSPLDKNIDPRIIAEDVIACSKMGASMVHLHVREYDGSLTDNLSVLEETVHLIKEGCDIIIEISTGGVSQLTIQQRCVPCYPDYVEANSLNVGSVNLGESVYQNPIRDVRYCIGTILEQNKIPEIEVFELGMIHTVYELAKEFQFQKPYLFALVFGHRGEMPAEETALMHMKEYLFEKFREPEEVLWGYTQANRKDWSMMKYALSQGAFSVRIGFEDSACLGDGSAARTNAELVEELVQVMKDMDLEPMGVNEARDALQIGRNRL
ncbi:MAG: 3-keto-5-aminohexanoate cleavage protein [Lachnospiraceae bacterium]